MKEEIMTNCLEIHRLQSSYQWEARRMKANERLARLNKLKDVLVDRLPQLRLALVADLSKNYLETDLAEAATVLSELNWAIAGLKRWMKPRAVMTPLTLFGTKSQIVYEPKGVALIFGTWNYPASLALVPLIAAVAAENCAILKPSELAPATSAFLRSLIEAVFPPEEVAVVEGGPEVAQELLKLKFDHIFFTGSTRVGRLVMEAAAKHLTPVTLELGGKTPAIVTPSADLQEAAESLMWGKFINSGQTRIAPDFILVHEAVAAGLLRDCRSTLAKFYGANESAWISSPDLCRIVNATQFERLKFLYDSSVAAGAKRETGGVFDNAGLRIAPAILSDVTMDMPIMKEEIFGPLLPVITYQHVDEAISLMRRMSKPLASYIYSYDEGEIARLRDEIPAGGTCINTCVVHVGHSRLPYGGIGESGMGSYHGEFGFKTFSHERAVLKVRWFDPLRLFRPPYSDSYKTRMAWLLKYLA